MAAFFKLSEPYEIWVLVVEDGSMEATKTP